MSHRRPQHNGERPRVVVTGIGMVTPFGVGRETSWRGMLSGESATRRVGEMIGAPAPELRNSCEAGHVDPLISLALAAAEEAVDDAGLPADVDQTRLGCVIGTSKPALRSVAELYATHRSSEPANAAFLDVFPDAPGVAVARRLGIAGPSLCPVAACATGLVCLQRGYELIRDGECDAVLAGSSDASLLPIVHTSFKRMGVLAKRVDDPSTACRPFDAERSGFVIGEGAAVFVIERLDRARERGARVYAEWLAGGLASDGAALTALDDSGEALAWLIADVLRRADVEPAQIDYVNLHGTATRQNDRYETRALHRAFGARAKSVPCSSLKGGIGHLLGAAGSVETAATLLAMRDGVIPPTVNLTNPDPACDLDCVPQFARELPVRAALKLSLGFGGHLVAAVLGYGNHASACR